MSERKAPVMVPQDVLEGLEAARRYFGTDIIDAASIRDFGNERGHPALAVWVHRHPDEYGRGVLDGFQAARQ